MAMKRKTEDFLDRLERWRSSQVDETTVDYLLDRTIGKIDASIARQRARRQYTCILPNSTLYEQEIPAYLRRFSPCGQYLIGFGRSNHSLIIFRVTYPAGIPDCAVGEKLPLLSYVYFFEQVHEVILCGGSENLCRDFLLFTPDGRHMIVASAETASPVSGTNGSFPVTGLTNTFIPGNSSNNSGIGINHTSHPASPTQNHYPHSLASVNTLDEIRFHIVELQGGRLTDRLKLSQDYVLLSMHAGVAMNGRTLGILSHHHQVIRLFEIDHNGKFQAKGVIGHSLYLDDSNENNTNGSSATNQTERSSLPLLGLRQRLMAFLYRRAINQNDGGRAIRILYVNWTLLESLCMCRMQFLDSNHLLIKLCCPEAIGAARLRSHADSGLQSTAFFLIYRLSDTQICGFYRSTDADLYVALRDYNDFVRIRSSIDLEENQATETSLNFGERMATDSSRGHSWHSTPANDLYERQSWDRSVQLLMAARPLQPEIYSAKRMLLNLPYASQSISESPYVDPSLFRFDDRAVSALDRQRNVTDLPVRFYSRRSDHLKFKLNSGLDPQTAPAGTNPFRVKKYTQWIFHPWLPLVISSQHTLVRSTIFNIHYHSPIDLLHQPDASPLENHTFSSS